MKNNSKLVSNILPVMAGGVVGGIVAASGGSGLQIGVGAIATGTSGYVCSALTNNRIIKIKEDTATLEAWEKRQTESNALKTKINESQGTLISLKQEIKEKEDQQAHLLQISAQLLPKQKELEELNKKLPQLREEAAELEIFKSHYDALKKESTELETRKQELNTEIPRLELEKERILAEIRNTDLRLQQAESLRIKIENLNAKIRSKESDLNSLERQINQLDVEQTALEKKIAQKKSEIKQQQEKLEEIQAKIREAKGEQEEIENSVKQAFQALKTPIEVKANSKRNFVDEKQFITEFQAYLTKKNLTFSERIIKAFHTSLKVQDISALVILAGISGTGKSELPQAYAEFIGAPLVMLPVQPRWDSPQDLQGFYNYIEKKYKPTELMRYLYQHQHDSKLQGRIIMVLLDEMNLARVEYYFSDFLSKLETRRIRESFLEIEAGSLKLSEEERRVKITQEFLFVGTMNEDETTQSLSDKVLDRANVLTFGKPFKLKLRGEKYSQPSIYNEYLSWENFCQWMREPREGDELMNQVQDYVNRANKSMEALGRPFAHRVYQAIAKYVVNYPGAVDNEEVRKQAIADQFGQKILPKLRGLMVEDNNVKPELERLKSLVNELEDQSLIKAFEIACQGQYGQFQWKGMVEQEDLD